MLNKGIASILMLSVSAGLLFTGCGKTPEKHDESMATTTLDRDFSSVQTSSDNGVINHGHSIKDRTEPDPREIRRSSDVILTEAEAYKFFMDSIEFREPGLEFVLTDTSDDDPGAYMWYEFTAVYDGYLVMNATFTVIAFTDGSILEGRYEFTECAFYDSSDVLKAEDALKKYRENTGDNREMRLKDKCYFYSGGYNERCPMVYVYRYSEGKILINAATGEMVGLYKDWID